MYFLNIAIPVYKRPEMLKELLDSISRGYINEVCVSIFDDSDIDYLDNKIVADYYLDKIHIFYNKNISNLGIDKNIAQCFVRSTGRYTIVIGEDDLFLPQGLSLIISALKENYPKILFLRYTYFNGVKDIDWSKSVLEKYETMDFLGSYIDKLGFIGSFAIETKQFDMQIFIEDKTYFNHVGCLLVGLESIKNIYSTSDNVIRNRVGNIDVFSWQNEALNVFKGFGRILAIVESRKLRRIDISSLRLIANKKFNPFIFRRLIKLKAQNILTNSQIYFLGSNENVGPHRFLAILIPKSICILVNKIQSKKIWF